MFIIMLLAVFGLISLCQSSHHTHCTLPILRQCHENDTSVCCEPLANTELNMEIAIKAGDFFMGRNLFLRSSGRCLTHLKGPSFTGRVRTIIETMSSLMGYQEKLTPSRMDVVFVLSNLLTDLQNKTCEWISDCIVIPSELTCEDFLAQYSMFFSLKQSAVMKKQFSDQLKSCFDNQWCIWWMERTMCQENEIIAYKNGYYCTPVN